MAGEVPLGGAVERPLECLKRRGPTDPDDAGDLEKRNAAQPERHDLLFAPGNLQFGLRTVRIAAVRPALWGVICCLMLCLIVSHFR